jgi:hypothetical protein
MPNVRFGMREVTGASPTNAERRGFVRVARRAMID